MTVILRFHRVGFEKSSPVAGTIVDIPKAPNPARSIIKMKSAFLLAILSLAQAQSKVTIEPVKQDKCSLVGNWTAKNLPRGGDPGAPDESLINVSENWVNFPNGGGGFANSMYHLKSDGCGTIFNSGRESITVDLVDDKLVVVFSGGDYSRSARSGKFSEVVYRRCGTEAKCTIQFKDEDNASVLHWFGFGLT